MVNSYTQTNYVVYNYFPKRMRENNDDFGSSILKYQLFTIEVAKL